MAVLAKDYCKTNTSGAHEWYYYWAQNQTPVKQIIYSTWLPTWHVEAQWIVLALQLMSGCFMLFNFLIGGKLQKQFNEAMFEIHGWKSIHHILLSLKHICTHTDFGIFYELFKQHIFFLSYQNVIYWLMKHSLMLQPHFRSRWKLIIGTVYILLKYIYILTIVHWKWIATWVP